MGNIVNLCIQPGVCSSGTRLCSFKGHLDKVKDVRWQGPGCRNPWKEKRHEQGYARITLLKTSALHIWCQVSFQLRWAWRSSSCFSIDNRVLRTVGMMVCFLFILGEPLEKWAVRGCLSLRCLEKVVTGAYGVAKTERKSWSPAWLLLGDCLHKKNLIFNSKLSNKGK